MSDVKKPRLPDVGEYVRMHGILIDVKTVNPPVPKPIKEYIFEECSARQELRFKDGEVLQTLGTYNNFYGLGTAVKSSIKELKAYSKKKGFDKNSNVEAVVVKEIRQYPATPNAKENYYNKEFVDFDHQLYSDLKNKEIDVWSSKRGHLKQWEKSQEDG